MRIIVTESQELLSFGIYLLASAKQQSLCPAKWSFDFLQLQCTRFSSGCSWLPANKLLLSLSSNNIPLLLLLLLAPLLLLQLLVLCSSMISRSSSSSSSSSSRSSDSSSSFRGDRRNLSLQPDDSFEADDDGRFRHEAGESLPWNLEKIVQCQNLFNLERR